MFTGIPIPTDSRSDWLRKRTGGIGGSDVAAIAGISPYRSAMEVWAEKTGRIDVTDDQATEVMRWGQRLEGAILDEWEDRTGLSTFHRGSLFRHMLHDHWLVTVDGLVCEQPAPVDLGEATAVAEVKSVGDWSRWEDIPAHYEVQAQWQMRVTGLDRVIFPVLHGGRRLEVYETEADPKLQARLIDLVEQFWWDHVQTEKPPPAVAADNSVLAGLYGAPDGEVEATDEILDVIAELNVAKFDQKLAQQRRDVLEARVKAFMEDAEALVHPIDGRTLVTWKQHERKAYVRTVEAGTYRRFDVKEKGDS